MKPVCDELKEFLSEPTALLGVGNALKGDDAFGPLLVEALTGKVSIPLFDAGTAPENYLGPILRSGTPKILFVDAADFGAAPGTQALLRLDEISDLSFSTHTASLKLFADLILDSNPKVDIRVLVLQPKGTCFGDEPSPELREAVVTLSMLIQTIFPA